MTRQAIDCPIIIRGRDLAYSEPTIRTPRYDEGWSSSVPTVGTLKDWAIELIGHEIEGDQDDHQSQLPVLRYGKRRHRGKSNQPFGVIDWKPPEKGTILVKFSDWPDPAPQYLRHDDSPEYRFRSYWIDLRPSSPSAKEKQEALEKIVSAEDQEEVLNLLTERGLSTVVEGFRQYLVRREKSLEEGESPGVNLDSLKAVVQFLVSYDLPHSAIKADFEGNADLEWFLSSRRKENHPDDEFWGEGDGQMILRFVSSKAIEFAVLSGPWVGEKERLSLTGTLSHSKMKAVIDMFIGRVVSYGKR